MTLTEQHRRILIVMGSILGALLLLLVVYLAACAPNNGANPQEPVLPSAPPERSDPPFVPTSSPTATPSPTDYRLPLVPHRSGITPAPDEEEDPTADPDAFLPPDVLSGRYDDSCKDLLAVGLHNGVPAAILLARLEGETITVTGIPAETVAPVYTLNDALQIQNIEHTELYHAYACGGGAKNMKQGCWNLVWSVKNLTGVLVETFVCIELECLELLFTLADDPEGARLLRSLNDTSGIARTERFNAVGLRLLNALRRVRVWELSEMQTATKDKMTASLTVRQLIALAMSFQKITVFETFVLPVTEDGSSVRADRKEVQNFFEKLWK